MARSTADVDLSGPFFTADPGMTLLENIQKMMQGIADEGAKAAREGLLTGSANRALVRMTDDRVADHVIGRTYAKSGKRWLSAAVVQVTNEGMDAATSRSLMAAGSFVERRTAAIRRVGRQISSSRAVLSANLSAGLE